MPWRALPGQRRCEGTVGTESTPVGRDDQPPSPPRLELHAVGLRLGGRCLFRSVELELPPCSGLGIVGPSGAGKTTLLRLLLGLQDQSEGMVSVDGKAWADLRKAERTALRRRFGWVQQQPGLLRTTALGNVSMILRWRGFQRADAQARAAEALRSVGLGSTKDKAALGLSGGERQRLALARALVTEPEVLLLDEFTNHQDPDHEEVMEALVLRRHRAGATLVFVGHDLGQAARLHADSPGGLKLAVLMEGQFQVFPWDELQGRASGEGAAGRYLRKLGAAVTMGDHA